METRTFVDRTGVEWRVSEIPADAHNASEVRERRAQKRISGRNPSKGKLQTTRPHSWLYFESKSERRKVSRIPDRWEHLSDEDLEDLMGQSRPL